AVVVLHLLREAARAVLADDAAEDVLDHLLLLAAVELPDLLRDDVPVVRDLQAPRVVPGQRHEFLLLGLQAFEKALGDRLGLLLAPGRRPHGRLRQRRRGRGRRRRLHEAATRHAVAAVGADLLVVVHGISYSFFL